MSLTDTSGTRGRWYSAAAGVLLPLSFAPFEVWFLAIPLFAALFHLWDGVTPREAAWRGFWFGFAAFASGAYWLYISIHVFGGAPVPVAATLMLGLFWCMAIYAALSGYLAARLATGSGFWRWSFVWPAIFVVFEWLRGWMFTGFPWLTIGYGQIDGPFGAWAPLGGVHAVSFVTVVLGGVLLSLIRCLDTDRIVAGATCVCVFVATWALQDRDWTQSLPQTVRVSLVQGSISQDRKWLPEQRLPTMALYRDLTFELSNRDLVVWPEVAIPTMQYVVQDYLDDLGTEARARNMQIYLGILTLDATTRRYRNSLIGIGLHDAAYHKRHLVPFGEFFPVPDFVRQWMRSKGLPNQDTTAGGYEQQPLPLGELLMSPSICYEDAYGSEQLDFLPDAHMLINVSNDAWFGESIAPHQHLQIARMRALESGRPMLRATNTGVTAIIAPDGRIARRLPQFETRVLSGVVKPRTGVTPYVSVGNVPLLIGCLALIGVAGYLRRRGSVYASKKGSLGK